MRILVGALAPTALANHGPGTSGGGTSTLSGETLKKGGFDLSLRTDVTWYETFTLSEAADHAVQSGEFDAIESRFGFECADRQQLLGGLGVLLVIGELLLEQIKQHFRFVL